jgi:hypothetical protein
MKSDKGETMHTAGPEVVHQQVKIAKMAAIRKMSKDSNRYFK